MPKSFELALPTASSLKIQWTQKNNSPDVVWYKEQFGVWDGAFGAGLCIQGFIFCCDFFTMIFPLIKEGCGAAGEIQRADGLL